MNFRLVDVRFCVNLDPTFKNDEIQHHVRFVPASGKLTIQNVVTFDTEKCEFECSSCTNQRKKIGFGKELNFSELNTLQIFNNSQVTQVRCNNSVIFSCHVRGESVINSFDKKIQENNTKITSRSCEIDFPPANLLATSISQVHFHFLLIPLAIFVLSIKFYF